MEKDNKLNSDYIDCLPEIEYFLNANLSSLLNGYIPPKDSGNVAKVDEPEVLDDDFFEDIDKKVKF